jgi:hypothetical protein
MTYKILRDDSSLIFLNDVGSTYRKLSKISEVFIMEEYSIVKKSLINSQKFGNISDLNFSAELQQTIKDFF